MARSHRHTSQPLLRRDGLLQNQHRGKRILQGRADHRFAYKESRSKDGSEQGILQEGSASSVCPQAVGRTGRCLGQKPAMPGLKRWFKGHLVLLSKHHLATAAQATASRCFGIGLAWRCVP